MGSVFFWRALELAVWAPKGGGGGTFGLKSYEAGILALFFCGVQRGPTTIDNEQVPICGVQVQGGHLDQLY